MDRLVIARMGLRGDGVAEGPAGQLHVRFSLPGEEVSVEAEPDTGRPRLVAVARASPDRVAPICRYFGACGGCKLQHWAPEPYLAWKRGLVVEALRAHGIDAPVMATIDAHGTGRRRATFHARREGQETRTGFMQAGSHTIVAIEACPVLAPAMAGAPVIAAQIAEILTKTGKPLDIAVTATGSGLDVTTKGHGPLSSGDRQRLIALAERRDLARLSNHNEVIVQRRQPLIGIGRCQVAPPPGAFLQATAAGEEALAGLVEGGSGKAKRVADLFCGIGPFALRLASKRRVSAFDSDAYAIAALIRAARGTQGLKPLDAQARDLFRRPLLPLEINSFDAVILDPPRQGAVAQIKELARSSIGRVVYVSCDAATFARDAGVLVGAGFRLDGVTPVDQFRYSAHIELVGTFTR